MKSSRLLLCTSLTVGLLALFSLAYAGFPDVPQTHENVDGIEHVRSERIVSGYPDGTYRPDNEVNRAEFTKILIGSRYSAEEISACMQNHQKLTFFPDVVRTEWFAPYVCLAKQQGIIEGYPDGRFRPELPINFAEASKIITGAYYATQRDPDQGAWYASFVQELADKNAIPLSIVHFDSPLRRGEMAEVIYRLRTGVQKPSQTFEQMAERSAPGGSTTPIEGVSDACDTGWACKDATHKAFRQADCTWKMESTCAFGCVAGKCRETDCQQADCENFCADGIRYFNGRCVGVGCRYISSKCQYGCDGDNCRSTSVPVTDTDSCENMTCPDYCSSDVRYFNGRCEDGTCEYSTQLCSEDCENGKCVSASVGPCAGVTCNDYCDGNTRKYNGQCSEGNCSYMSEVCGFGCSGGQCNQDDCQGITCDDYCDGINAYSDGYCHDGQCQYETIASCPYECDGTICLEYHCQWSWPQKIINKNTAVVVWPCTSARPYCQMGTTLCCKKDGPGQGYPYYDCQNMETGELQDGGEQDSDEDGMPDDWERENGLDETTWDPDQDPDGDGFTNLDEYEGGTDPQDPMSHPFSDDLDMDGMSDAWEIENGLDETTWDADQDPDLDGYTNLEEYESSTDPQDPMSIPS